MMCSAEEIRNRTEQLSSVPASFWLSNVPVIDKFLIENSKKFVEIGVATNKRFLICVGIIYSRITLITLSILSNITLTNHRRFVRMNRKNVEINWKTMSKFEASKIWQSILFSFKDTPVIIA